MMSDLTIFTKYSQKPIEYSLITYTEIIIEHLAGCQMVYASIAKKIHHVKMTIISAILFMCNQLDKYARKVYLSAGACPLLNNEAIGVLPAKLQLTGRGESATLSSVEASSRLPTAL